MLALLAIATTLIAVAALVATGAFAIVALGVYVIKKRRNMNANMNS